MSGADDLVRRGANDLGGRPAEPIVISEHELLPWEKRCHALLDVLATNRIVNTEEKRRGIDDLGSELLGRLTYYEKWILSASNVLMQKGILTSDEIAQKVEAVRDRLGAAR
jgi:Nitrile hydratase beta subunit